MCIQCLITASNLPLEFSLKSTIVSGFMWTTSLLLHQDFTQIFPSFWHIVLASLPTSTYSLDLKFVTFLDVPRKNSKVHHPNYINHSTIYFYRILEIINYIGADTEQDFIFS